MADATILIESADINVADQTVQVDLVGGEGPSVYQTWLAAGHTGTLTDFFNWLVASAGITVTSATGQVVTSRALLAAIASPANGQSAVLTEAGRSGRFQFSTANLSSSVTLDPYQGLYVAPASATTGASGAWVRQVPDNTFHTEWWGMQGLGNNGHLGFASALVLMPAGATLIVDPGDTVFSSTVRILKSINIDGFGYLSRIKWNSGAAATHVIIVSASNCKIRNIRVSGSLTGAGAGNPSCIIVTGKDASPTVLTPVDDVEISGCTLDNCSLPLCFFADTLNGSGAGGTVAPVTRSRAHHNLIRGNVQCVSMFGCDDCEISDNVIEADVANPCPPGTPFNTIFRILGSRRFHVHDNICLGFGASGSNGGNEAIYFSAASFGSGQPRRQNQDGMICDNTFRDVAAPIVLNESTGLLTIKGNKFYGDPTLVNNSVAVSLLSGGTADGVMVICERVHIVDNLFRGYAAGVNINPYSSGGQQIKHILVTGNTFIGNLTAGSFPSDIFTIAAPFGGVLLMNCTGNRFLMRQGNMTLGSFSYQTTLAGEILIMMDNWMPERASANRANGIGGFGGSGTFIMARGGETLAATYGSNMIYPDGSFAASA